MANEYYSDIFPEQMFPDVELGSVALTENTLTVSINDSQLAKTGDPASEWVMSKDDEDGLFYGEGDMIFSYEGAATLKWRNLREKVWHEGGQELLPRLAALDLVRRNDDSSMLLQFSNREEEEGFVLSILLENVETVEWTGEEEEEEEEEDEFGEEYDDDDDDDDDEDDENDRR